MVRLSPPSGLVRSALLPTTLLLAIFPLLPARAEVAAEIEALSRTIAAQAQRLDEQAAALAEQRRALDAQRRQLEQLRQSLSADASAPGAPPPPAPSADPPAGSAAAPPAPAEQPPRIDLLADRGGVLTRRGWLVVEPQLEYQYDTSNQFFFDGVEIVDTVLIGLIEANQARNKTLTSAVALRYGLTDRLEADVRVPWVWRDSELTEQAVNGDDQRSLDQQSAGIGDVEFGIHYQLNRGLAGWPWFVANLRAKSATGDGPYDVDPDDDEAALGSGFWAIEPSLTVIYPSDPAVLFGNVGWVHSFGRDIDKTVVDSFTGQAVRIEDVEPGDTWRLSFGVGVALNEQVSVSVGYAHDWVQSTRQRFRVDGERQTAKTESFQVGQLAFGLSYAVSERVGVNVNTSVGVTDEAPDTRIGIRVPVALQVFD